MQKSKLLKTETTHKKYIYPFLFALYPVFFLYLHNIREVLPARLIPALGVSLAIAIAFWILTRIVTRQFGKRSLLLFFFLLLFHFYGLYYGLIAVLLPDVSRPFLSHAIALILPGGLWLFLSLSVVRSTRSFETLNRVLQLLVIFLTLWNGMGILIYYGNSFFSQNQLQLQTNPQLLKNLHNQASTPDIYCFILDEFASLESARYLFQYDNSIFAETLRQQGFFVAQNSHSRFFKTEYAIADILNLGEFSSKSDPFLLIRKNVVAKFLKQRGYRIIDFPLSPEMSMKDASQHFHYSLVKFSIFFDDFYRILFEHSLLRFLPDRWLQQKPDSCKYYREQILQTFDKLPSVVKIPGPKFVYIHLYSPHEPFVFNAQGETVAVEHIWDHSDPRYYLGQYKFISSKMVALTARILEISPAPPVIIIQSDHGYRGSRGRTKFKRQVPLTEMVKVFNALHLPGVDPNQIELSLAPLNNFRLIFNQYFGEHYPLLQNP